VTVGYKTYSTADGSLKEVGSTSSTGSDALGKYAKVVQAWTAGTTAYETSTRTYIQVNGGANGMVVFAQTWPDGAEGTSSSKDHAV
jgi:hypothetical protein